MAISKRMLRLCYTWSRLKEDVVRNYSIKNFKAEIVYFHQSQNDLNKHDDLVLDKV